MTGTETTEGTAELVQVAPGALARVKDGRPWTVADLADIIAAPAAEVPKGQPLPDAPAQLTITERLRKAMRALPAVFGSVQPTERRRLEQAEIARITDEYLTIEAIKGDLGKRQEAIKEAIRVHQDFEAEDQGRSGLRVAGGAAKGHYLAAFPRQPFETPVQGMEDGWQQRYVKGETTQDVRLLEEALQDGKITRAEYLAFTREVRELDDDKIRAAIKKDPARGLAILGLITRRSAPGASLYAPKK